MKFLFKHNIIAIIVRRTSMVLQVFLNHFIGYIPSAPNPIAYRPKMPAPVPLAYLRKFLLKPARCPSFQTLYDSADALRRRILYVDMNMILTYHSLQYSYILRITYLLYQVTATYLYIAFKNMITILRYPYYMSRQPRYCMTASPLRLAHLANVQRCVATESLALKVHSFN